MAVAPAMRIGAPGTEPRLLVFTTGDPVHVVIAWHNRHHPDPWCFCSHELCDSIRGRDYRP